MACLLVSTQIEKDALAVDTKRSVIRLKAPANIPLKVVSWAVYFDGVAATDVPVQIAVKGGTEGGTFTNPLSTTIDTHGSISVINGASDTPVSEVATTCTSEPTTTKVYDMACSSTQDGYSVFYPDGKEIVLGGGEYLFIECLSHVVLNARARIIYEE